MNSMPKSSPEKELVEVLNAADVVDFLEYLKSGKRIFWVNFRAGVAKGLGVTVGMTVVLGLLVWVLTILVDLPLVGEYFVNAKSYVTEYVENTNYKADFEAMNIQLKEINENIKTAEGPEAPQQE
jgi:phage shock protein PspC (stress-responsive transcriptional regulator)